MELGFVSGRLKYKIRNDEKWIDCSSESNDYYLPISSLWTKAFHDFNNNQIEDCIELESNAIYLLIIEKDGIFHRLVEDKIYE